MREAVDKLWRAAQGAISPGVGMAIRPGAVPALPTAVADMEGWLLYRPGFGTYTCQKVGAAYVWTLAGAGDVTGPAASVDGEIALFSSTTGKVLKRATGTGLVTATSGVYGTTTAPAFSDFTNANHDHGDADDGGNIPATSVTGLSLVWLETLSPSGASSSSSSAIFTSTYQNYLVVANLSMSASNASLTMRLRVAGADSSSALYYYGYYAYNSAATSAAVGGATQTQFQLIGAQGVGVTITDTLVNLTIGNPQATDETTVTGNISFRIGTPLLGGETYGGMYNATTSYDAISIIPSSGNITGTIRIYGLRNS